jgi:hypothetical protein
MDTFPFGKAGDWPFPENPGKQAGMELGNKKFRKNEKLRGGGN